MIVSGRLLCSDAEGAEANLPSPSCFDASELLSVRSKLWNFMKSSGRPKPAQPRGKRKRTQLDGGGYVRRYSSGSLTTGGSSSWSSSSSPSSPSSSSSLGSRGGG